MGRKGNNGAEIGSMIPFLSAHPARLTFFVFARTVLTNRGSRCASRWGQSSKVKGGKGKKRLRISRKQIRVLCRRVCAMNPLGAADQRLIFLVGHVEGALTSLMTLLSSAAAAAAGAGQVCGGRRQGAEVAPYVCEHASQQRCMFCADMVGSWTPPESAGPCVASSPSSSSSMSWH